MQDCWTEHSYYSEISYLTNLQMEGFIAKDKMKEVDQKINAMFDEMYLEGVNCEGYEPKWEVVKKAMLEGTCADSVYHDYSIELKDGKLYHEGTNDEVN